MQILLENAILENWKVLFKHTQMSTSHERDQVGWLVGWFLNYQIQPSVIHGSVTEPSCLVCLKRVPYLTIAKINLNNS